jgi:glycosyltransferase involved in cell wall biosynthesis
MTSSLPLPPQGDVPPISVVICTFNRAPLLEDAIVSLYEQTCDPALFEVLVVDNNSTDDTAERCERLMSRYPTLRMVKETRTGLSHARNRGLEEARGCYIGYLDDDAKVPPHWIQQADRIIRELAPLAFGGPYVPYYNSPKPFWYKDAYGSREPAESTRWLQENESLTGNNMFFRRDVLEELGGFDPRLGMTGYQVEYGEETAVQRCIFYRWPDRADRAIYNVQYLFIYHLAPARKLSLRWRVVEQYQVGRSYPRMQASVGSSAPGARGGCRSRRAHRVLSERAITPAVRLLRFHAGNFVKGFLIRDRERYPYWQNYFYESGSIVFFFMGCVHEYLSLFAQKLRRRPHSLDSSSSP